MIFKIRKPVWNGRRVGLADYKLQMNNVVEILVTDKDGLRLYPNPYTITGEEARKWPLKSYAGTPALRLVPISELKESTDEVQTN